MSSELHSIGTASIFKISLDFSIESVISLAASLANAASTCQKFTLFDCGN